MAKRINWSFHLVNAMLVLYWLLLFYLTHMQSQRRFGLGHADKVAHFLAYGGLAFMLAWALIQFRGLSRSVCWTVICVITIYAIADEASQSFIPGRHADVWDATADVLGGLAGLATIALIMAIRNPVSSTGLMEQKSEV